MSDVVVTGANGAYGTSGYGTPSGNGGPGGAGGAAIATNYGAGGDASNTATAVGGYGGQGGRGWYNYVTNQGGRDGVGGAGGAATAVVSFATPNAGATDGYAKALGGAGGGGYNGGAGGAASATTYVAGGGPVQATAYAHGGDSPAGYSAPGTGAGGNATGSATALSITTAADNVTATATVLGGDGGAGGFAPDIHGIPGLDTTGGQGGNVTDAASSAIAISAIGGVATAITRATGGAGGYVGGVGGTASGSTASANGFSAKAIVYQTGGSGGYGAFFSPGGAGASSTLNNAVYANAHGGYAYLKQIATGGAGGGAGYSFFYPPTQAGLNAGNGGAATSTLSFTNSGASAVTAVVSAYGGAGGQSKYGSDGFGGAATAAVNVTALHATFGEATAIGGSNGYEPTDIHGVAQPGVGAPGQGGAASATVVVTVTGSGAGDTATALATATGGYGLNLDGLGDFTSTTSASAYTAAGQQARATAQSATTSSANAGTGGAGVVTTITTHAQAANAGSYAIAGGDDLDNQTAANAYALATYSPSANFTAPVLADPKLKAAINTVFAGALMGGTSYYTGGAGTQVFDSASAFTLNNSGLAGDLILGLLAPHVTGAGFSDLVFTVTVNGVEKIDQNFTSLSDAQTYFTDDAIDLGAFAGQSAIKVVVGLDVTTDTFGETFDTNFVLGQETAPPVSVMLTSGGPITLAQNVTQALLLPPSGVPYTVTANSNPNLAITDRAGTADTIILGAGGQSVLTYGAGSTDHVIASTGAEAGDLIRNLNHAADLLEITIGGTFALNPQDFNVLVKLDQPSTLTLAGFQAGVEGNTGGDTIIVAGRQLWSTSAIDLGGVGNTLTLQGGGYFDLRAPAVLTGIQTLNAQEAQGGAEQVIYLRDGLDLTVNVASDLTPGAPPLPGVIIHGANNADVINLGSGNDTVYVGGINETVKGGGDDSIYVTAATLAAHIDGGGASSTLDLTGGGTAVMGASITDIGQAILQAAPTGQTQPAWDLTANTIAGLKISDLTKTADTITFGAGGQIGADVGGGGDTFRFTSPTLGGDQIQLFHSGLDHIGLSATGFGLTSLTDVTFDFGPSPVAANNGEPAILYDTRTGALSFDASGGDGHVVQFATLTGHPTLLASDFTLA